MKKHIFLLIILSLLIACKQNHAESVNANNNTANLTAAVQTQEQNASVVQAFQNKKSNIFVEGVGTVKKLLPDDNKGSRHQKFLVAISAEQTLLFAHNIDLAPAVPLSVSDTIQFRGEYVYNPKGGVMHWTHRDPEGSQKAGWIKHNGKTYQ
jgi:hypothetical protein